MPLDTNVSKQIIEVKQECDNVMSTWVTHLKEMKMRPKKKKRKERKDFQFANGWDKKLSHSAEIADYGWLALFPWMFMVISSYQMSWDMRK